MPAPSEPGNGLGELRGRRQQRQRRQPPPPRHPRPEPAKQPDTPDTEKGQPEQVEATPEPAREIPREIPREVAPEAAGEEPRPAPVEPAGKDSQQTGRQLPSLEVDLNDPAAMMVTPTVLSIPGSILRRFEVARQREPSHTALVLDALRAHAADLPDLVLALRPGPRPGDLFPYRATPGARTEDKPGPLRIRPTAGELAIMDALTGWVNEEISRRRPGSRKVSRSETVAVALDAYLPRRKRQPA